MIFQSSSTLTQWITCGLLFGTLTCMAQDPDNEVQADRLLLDDFSIADASSFGTRWEAFSDRVMGGVSQLSAERIDGDPPKLRLQGTVRLDNNGGFIQVRLPLARNGNSLDAGDFKGVAIRVRGKPGAYYLHLRTASTRRPWQYFRAPISISSDWSEQRAAFADFEAVDTRIRLDPAELTSVAVVAYGKEFRADIEIARIELVGE